MPLLLCQAVGCSHPIKPGVFMCRPHWFALPGPLRQQINATWRVRSKGAKAGIRANARNIIAHVEACDEGRRWTAEGEGRLADYAPDADRLKKLVAMAAEDEAPKGRLVPPHGSGP